MAKVRGDISIDIEKCKGCELCVVACPQEALALAKDINKQGYHYAVLIEDVCTGCTNCSLVCPDAVITVYREDKKTGAKRKPRAERTPAFNDNSVLSIADQRSFLYG